MCLSVGSCCTHNSHQSIKFLYLFLGSFLELTHNSLGFLLLIPKQGKGRDHQTYHREDSSERICSQSSPECSESVCKRMCDGREHTSSSSLCTFGSCISSTGSCRGTCGSSLQSLFLGVKVSISSQGSFPCYSLVLCSTLQLFLSSGDPGSITRLFCPVHLIACCLCSLHSRNSRLLCCLHLCIGSFHISTHSFQAGSSTGTLSSHLSLQSSDINRTLRA